ncbi:hypothetical protein QUF86_20220 [Peribacillus sp. NJ11]|uniref:hypothetical protein n=1 Tax=Peribacillus sp. NJ11 TaxID=3055861 RepID=UPI0025A29D63|nr:hypothetical protein [Peribacillus sp. NJ11]MDM5223021.1 hypothetical protein [Peribacillus sp. NJ11]
MNDKIKEVGYAIAKAGVGSIPLAGGVLSELFGVAFSDPASRRREQILFEMDERLNKLESEGFQIDSLAENDEFLSIAMQAYNIALRTHQADKRAALMNAISNTPRLSIDENEKLMMLNYIDSFNEWHLRILAFSDEPKNYFNEKTKPNISFGGKSDLLIATFPELKSRRTFYDRIVRDLYDTGLILHESLHGTWSEQGLWASGTTEYGKNLLAFISE